MNLTSVNVILVNFINGEFKEKELKFKINFNNPKKKFCYNNQFNQSLV